MAESPMPYKFAIAVGDLLDGLRESGSAFRRATVGLHHFGLPMEDLPEDAREVASGRVDDVSLTD
jgi:hypothetical protein